MTEAEIRRLAIAVADELEARARRSLLEADMLCDFCRKQRLSVRLLVSGITPHICDECVELAAKTVAAERSRR